MKAGAGKSLVTASKVTASLGVGALFLEPLFRVNLSKHVWLVATQAALALVLVVCVIVERSRRGVAAATVTTADNGDISDQPRSGGSRIERAAIYFGMSNSAEFALALGLFVALIVLSVLNVFRQTIDTDEPQHLHTIWGWTHGFVQYRDLHDNHMPLFQIVLAPIFAAIGERPTIVYWMRLALLPMNFVAAWSTYKIGAAIFSRRAGIWSMLAVGLFIGYFRDATDFAPSNLWLPLWLLCLAAMVGGPMDIRRALVAGLMLGFCFAVSIKSAVFLISIVVAAAGTMFLSRKNFTDRRTLVNQAAAFLFGAILVPAIIVTFFAAMGIWREFRYGVLDFNVLGNRLYESRIVYKSQPVLGVLILAMILPPVLYVAQWIMRASRTSERETRWRVFVLLLCATYFIVLQVFWAPISRSFHPIQPPAFVLVTGALLALPNRLPMFRRLCAVLPLPALIALVEVLVLLIVRPFIRFDKKPESELLRQILILTTPADYVLDSKCETIFRKRTSPLVIDHITNRAVQAGQIVDDAPRRCIETRTCVVSELATRYFSEPTRRFIESNYLPVSESLRVAGVKLAAAASGPVEFEIAIPAVYELFSCSDAAVAGNLDGSKYDGPRFLNPGRHTFESEGTGDTPFCIWSSALERGFRPVVCHAADKK